MSGKDLTDALRVLTEAETTRPEAPPAMKERGAAGKVRAGALLGGGGNGAQTFYLGGEKTIMSTDGLFTMAYPESAKTSIGGKTLTLGAIVVTTP